MSRCFPFPPPGYEKKPEAENLDLLTKEKRKEKKHKKEKKEKEKREHKEKKEKDRSKKEKKEKEKKDRKEKHKDRKKDKDIDKGRTSEDRRVEDGNEGTHNRESLQKSEEVKDSKLAEELGKRTKDDGAANRMVGSITSSSIHRKNEQMGVARPSPSLEKDRRVTDKKVFPVPIGSSQRNDGSSIPIENATNSPHRRIGNISTATSITDQERSKLHERFTVGIITDQNKNHGISRPVQVFPGLVNRKAEFAEKNVAPNSIAPAIDYKGKVGAKVVASTTRKNDLLGLPVESLSSIRCKTGSIGNTFIQNRMDGMVTAPPAIEKERVKGSGMFPDQRRNSTIFQPVHKDRNQKVDKEHSAKKNKPKDSDKHTKEEEEEEKKIVVIENNNIRNIGMKDQIDTLNSKPLLAPHKDNTTGIISRCLDETSNKRKNLKINGFILENDARPNKIPRLVASSSQPPAGLPLKPDRTLLDHKNKEMNGNGEVSLKSPHPDSKHLEQIYSVPKMEPCLENDDLEWLFDRCDSSQQKPERQKASSTSQVWGQALWIESADVVALPYVLPF